MKNSYDFDKKMLNMMRKLNESTASNKILREQVEMAQDEPQPQQSMKDDILVVNDVDVKMNSQDDADMKLMDEQKKEISGIIDNFKQQVSQIVNFEPGFSIFPDQIRLDGKLTDEDMKFVFIAGKDGGVYVIADMLKLEQNVANTLEKLAKFNEVFKTSMEPIISQRNNN
jgi:ferritin-like metal-binding protein YciE